MYLIFYIFFVRPLLSGPFAFSPSQAKKTQKLTNNIIAHVRPGPSRPKSAYDTLCAQVKDVLAKAIASARDEQEKLDRIFTLGGGIVAGQIQFRKDLILLFLTEVSDLAE